MRSWNIVAQMQRGVKRWAKNGCDVICVLVCILNLNDDEKHRKIAALLC